MGANGKVAKPVVAVVNLAGKLTIDGGADNLGRGLEGLLELNVENIVFDLRDVERVDCAGIGRLADCYKTAREHGVCLSLTQANHQIHDLLSQFHLDSVLEDSRASDDTVPAEKPTPFEIRLSITPRPGNGDRPVNGASLASGSPVTEPGQIVSHYVIQQKLGEGGMGVVYEALDTRLQRKVALKFMKPEIVGSDGLKNRFVEEARAAAALDHPNICTIYDVDEASGQLFFSMAFVDGDSLARLIEKGPLEMGRALSIASQIAQGLEAAHEQHIVHRDIKPANVLVDSRGHAKITDFGVAHLTTSVTGSNAGRTVVGTPAYMSPEQARGERVDGRADIWSLGVLLFESLSGRLPFKDHRERRRAALTTYRPETPTELESIVARALAKRPSDRYLNAGEVVADLNALSSKLETVAMPAGVYDPACSSASYRGEPLPDSNGARPATPPAI